MRAGLYTDDSVTRRVNRENVLLLGGGRALLMQLAHPKVAAGVDEHSDFRADPLRRLRRTVRLTMAIVFGDGETVRAATRAVNQAHARVRGEGYRALDPELLQWVHATLVDSALVTYETFVRPLPREDREAFYEESKLLGTLLGIPREIFPATLADFRAYVARMLAGQTLHVGATARELSRLVVRPRVMRLPGAVFVPFEIVTAGLLPERLRRDYGLPWTERRSRVYRLTVRSVPRVVALTPPVLRVWPLPGRTVGLGGATS